MKLENKVIIVTGCATGIGKAIAKKCLQEGAKVLAHDRNKSPLLDWTKKYDQENIQICIEDLIHDSAANKIVDLAAEKFGQIYALVNNAAFIPSASIHSTDAILFTELLRINTIVPVELIKAALPYLTKSKGCVLNIGSVNAHGGEPNLFPYSVSKGALTTVTKNLGDSLMRENGIRVNQINPGWVLTENEAKRKKEDGFKMDWFKDLPSTFAPSGKIFSPEEIASTAIHLLSSEIGPISGQVWDIEQYPASGRNPSKNGSSTI
jgi:NAD(P)-dependent dehydrogenase (short-subunit alcohol dehydrogenase family)